MRLAILTLRLITINIFPITTLSQTTTLTGKVYDASGPVEGATVLLAGRPQGAITGTDGQFVLAALPSGHQTLIISATGYKRQQVALTLEAGTTLPVVEIALQPDPLLLEQVVVTGTRHAVPQYNSPVMVHTINSRTFEATQSLSLAEGLSFSPGLRLENNCQNCGFTQLRMNGLEGPYSQILINSRPIFSALAGVYGLEMLPANMVDRIEVVRGGGSALYGGNAIAGTVNIITKDPIENTFDIGFNQAYTGLQTPDRTFTANGALVSDKLDKGITLFGYHRNRAPWDANSDGFSEITQLRNLTGGADAFWNLGDRRKLKAGLYAISEFRRGGNGFDRLPHQTDLTEQLQHRILGAHTSYEQYSANYQHKLAAYASAQWVRRESYYGAGGRIIPPGEAPTEQDLLALNAYGNSRDASVVGGLQYAWEASKQWMLTAGMEHQHNQVRDAMPGYGRRIEQAVNTTGAYAQVEWKPLEALSLLAGGRIDHVRINGQYDLATEKLADTQTFTVAVPRITAMYALTENLKARASYAQGYRGPQAFDEDLHVQTVGGAARFVRLSPGLNTERSHSYTASLSYTRYVGTTQMSLVAEGFSTRLRNPFILSDPEELPSGVSVITKRNGEGARVQGLNLEANVAFTRKLILQSGFTLQQARYDAEEEIWTPTDPTDTRPATTTTRLLRNPNAYGFVTAAWNPNRHWSLAASTVYTGPMVAPHVIHPEDEYTIIRRTPAFLEQNLRFARNLYFGEHYRLQLFAGVQNLFNSYQRDFDTGPERDAGYVYGPARPRTLYVGIKWGRL